MASSYFLISHMRLSRLQKYILLKCLENKSGAGLRGAFYGFYSKEELRGKEKKTIIQEVTHRSLERLVSRDLLAAFGRKTAKKWFIQKVKLTTRGRRMAGEIIRKQQLKLPIK